MTLPAALLTVGQVWLALTILAACWLLVGVVMTGVRDYRTWERGYEARRRKTTERLCDVVPIRRDDQAHLRPSSPPLFPVVPRREVKR